MPQRPAARRLGGLRVGRQAALPLEQRLEQLGHRAQDVVGLRRDGLQELLVDAELAQVVDELRERRRREVDGQLLRAGLRRDAAGVERACALHAQLVGHARERVLQRVGVALEHEVLAEDREPQPLGLAVDVVRGAQLVLGQEAAQVDGLRVLVGVAAVLLGRLALEVLPQPQLRGCAPALVDVRVHRRRRRRLRSQPEEEVEEPVVGLDVLGGLDERRAQRVAHDRPLADADVAQRVQRVETLRRRHADVVAPQDADEVGDDPVHLVRVVVPVSVGVIVPGAAVELQHLARLRGVAVVLDDHAERRVDELAVQRLRP